jgi:hypothetical protein
MIKTFLKETIEGDGLASQERGFSKKFKPSEFEGFLPDPGNSNLNYFLRASSYKNLTSLP